MCRQNVAERDRSAGDGLRHIAGAAHEIQRINGDYDANLKRYRELVDGTVKMPCDPKTD